MKNMKRISLLLVLVLTLSLGAAFAEADVPSPGVGDSIVILEDTAVTSSGAELPEEFIAAILQPQEATPEETAVVQAAQEAISAFVTENTVPVIEYFPAEVQAAVIEQLPVDEAGALTVEAETLVLRELFPYAFNALTPLYAEEYGDVTVSVYFPVEFEADDTAIALLGVLPAADEEAAADATAATPDIAAVNWIVLPTVVAEDGTLEITFTADAFAQVGENDTTFIAVLAA